MTELEIRAEDFKQAEIKAVSTRNKGGYPRSIRKRGYHRALKRGEPWALIEEGMKNSLKVLESMYLDQIGSYENPFRDISSVLEKPAQPVELIYGLGEL